VPDRKPHFSLLRTFAFADLITLGNAACGTGAILLAMTYVGAGDRTAMGWALGLLPIALVLDVLDGQVARWRHRSSPLGADLDSLADIVSFGVAPAAVGFALGMRGLLDGVVLIYFVGCGISRLARFNVTAEELSAGTGKVRYYEGTPIPTSVLLVGALAWAFVRGLVGDRLPGGAVDLAGATLHPVVLAFAVSGSLMASGTLRIPKP
jgi:CDP-diacylglycerol--serine O-phosphatidyltransferase